MVGAAGRCPAEADARGAGSICAQFRRGSPGSSFPDLYRSASTAASGHSAAGTGASAAFCYLAPLSADRYARNKRDTAACYRSAAPRTDSHARTRGDPTSCCGNTSSISDGHATLSADGHTAACCTNIIPGIDGHIATCCAKVIPNANSHAMIRVTPLAARRN